MEYYATLSPNCAKADLLKDMFDNGMTGIRLNLSHVSLEDSAGLLNELHKAEALAGKKADIIIDTQGPEIRIGAAGHTLVFGEGDKIRFGEGGIPVPEIVLPFIKPGQEILLDDGKIRLEVGEDGRALVTRGGSFSGRKSMALPGAPVYPPTLTEADLANIAVAAEFGVTGLLQSFVRGRADLEAVRKALDSSEGDICIVSHATAMKAFLSYISDMPVGRCRDIKIGSAEVITLEAVSAGDGWDISFGGKTKHL